MGSTWVTLTFGRGGYGLDNWTWTLSVPRDAKGDVWDVWELPAALGAMLNMNEEIGAEVVRRKLRDMIGV